MASRVANPYGAATPLGEGLSSVFNAFLQAPTQEERAANALKIHGLQAGAKRDLAAADYDTSRTAGQTIANDALRALPTLDFNDPSTQGRVMQTMNGNYTSLADPFLVHLARQPGVTLDQMDPLAYARNGNAGNTMAGARMADATTQRGQDVTANTQRYGYDTQAATSRANNAADNAVKLQTFSVNTPAGTISTLAPGNPLGKTEIVGRPTTDTQKGQILAEERAKPGFDPNAPQPANTPVGAALDIPSPNQSNLRAVPNATLSAAAEYQQTIRQIDRAQELIKKGATLGMPLGFNILNALPGSEQLSQWFNPQEVAELRMLLTDIAGKRVHERYGAALTGTENTRAGAYIPNLTDVMGTIGTKLSNYRTQLTDGLGIAAGMYNDNTGYDGRPLMVAPLGTPASVPDPNAPRPGDTYAPQGAAAPGAGPTQNAAQLLQDAQSAINAGADRAAVAARYKQMTGQDLP